MLLSTLYSGLKYYGGHNKTIHDLIVLHPMPGRLRHGSMYTLYPSLGYINIMQLIHAHLQQSEAYQLHYNAVNLYLHLFLSEERHILPQIKTPIPETSPLVAVRYSTAMIRNE